MVSSGEDLPWQAFIRSQTKRYGCPPPRQITSGPVIVSVPTLSPGCQFSESAEARLRHSPIPGKALVRLPPTAGGTLINRVDATQDVGPVQCGLRNAQDTALLGAFAAKVSIRIPALEIALRHRSAPKPRSTRIIEASRRAIRHVGDGLPVALRIQATAGRKARDQQNRTRGAVSTRFDRELHFWALCHICPESCVAGRRRSFEQDYDFLQRIGSLREGMPCKRYRDGKKGGSK